jgi:dephospho-CoA kinase
MRVGLTGNIGSGKSTVCEVFKILGIPVFSADREAKGYYDTADGKKAVVEKFGRNILDGNTINFKKIASVVFNDKDNLEWLNNRIHPFVRKRFELWEARQSDAPCVIYEAAILFETGRYKEMDIMITISAPEKLRHQRIMKRDGISIEHARERESNQWKQEKKEELSDFVIHNDEKQLVVPQVIQIYNQIIR